MKKMEKFALAFAASAGLATSSCALSAESTPVIISEETRTVDQGLPEAVQNAAKAIVSVMSYDEVTVIKNSSPRTTEVRRSGYSGFGSGVHIGNGKVLTANHVGNIQNEWDHPQYNCLGQELAGQTETPFRVSVESSSSYVATLGDIALLHAPAMASQAKIELAPPASHDEEKVYLVNYQSTDNNETSETTIRNPYSPAKEWTTPAIFSGIAKRDQHGGWAIVTGKGITKEYGSGNPQRMTGGGSGGALLNTDGKLLGLSTYGRDMMHPTPHEITAATGVTFNSLDPANKYWLAGGPAISAETIEQLDGRQTPCAPDANDQVIIK